MIQHRTRRAVQTAFMPCVMALLVRLSVKDVHLSLRTGSVEGKIHHIMSKTNPQMKIFISYGQKVTVHGTYH